MKKVSVIVPCYNGEQFVDRCLNSILIQDYSNVECIVVDDGSTDLSKERILSFKKNFKEKKWELKYLYQENQGPGSAINSGLKLVTGDYLILLDIDDEYLPGALKEKADFLSNNKEYDIVRSNGWMVIGENKYLFIYEENEKKINDLFMALIYGKTNNWAGSYMVRTDKLFEFYPDREIYTSRYGQNLQILLPLSYKKACGYIDKPQMNYIKQETSLSSTSNLQKKEKKSIDNLRGYTDIRNHMINLIIKDEKEKEYVLQENNKAFYRSMMDIAKEHNNEKLLNDSYKALRKHGKVILDDKIKFYSYTIPWIALILRAIRKLKNKFIV